MNTQQTQQTHQPPQHSPEEIATPAANPPAPVPAPAAKSTPLAGSSQPPNQTGRAMFYVIGQVALLGMALASAKNFQVALGWVVLSLAFTQVMADSVHFTRPNLKKWVVGACTIIPGLIALVSSYIG